MMDDDFWEFIERLFSHFEKFWSESYSRKFNQLDVFLNPEKKEIYITMPLRGLEINSIYFSGDSLVIDYVSDKGRKIFEIPLAASIKGIKSYTFKNNILDIVLEVET